MTGREMLEKLGFEFSESRQCIQFIKRDEDNVECITFMGNNYFCSGKENKAIAISPEIHKAITQVLEDYGWL